MPEQSQADRAPEALSKRIENYRKEAQLLVTQGGEQSQYEFKRAVSLTRDNLADRLDFIKLIQSLANNTDIPSDRCVVIGADPKEHRFYPVANLDEFDPANLSKIFEAYLEPLPRFECFSVRTDDGNPFVLVVLDANQPRPIFVIKQGNTETGKTRLEVGDVWIKKNTNTAKAARSDIDAMYSVRIEEESEDRARKRFKHFQELGIVLQQRESGAAPKPSLLLGPRNELKAFAVELLATRDFSRLKMLLEVAREELVEGWNRANLCGHGSPSDIRQLPAVLEEFHKNEFLPALESVVEVGLIVIKNDFPQEWLVPVVDLLVEAFDSSRVLRRFNEPSILSGAVQWWRPAFEIFLGIRTIPIYAISRNRLGFLDACFHKLVVALSANESSRTKRPILFWPLPGRLFVSHEFDNGRAAYYWQDRIGAAWGSYFGDATTFIEASSQLEFLAELNSYIGNNWVKSPPLQQWLADQLPDVSFDYVPDLYAQDLQATTPIAERIYDALASGQPFPSHFAVVEQVFNMVLGKAAPNTRLAIYGEFLANLLKWQAEYRRQVFSYWGYFWRWEGRLGKLVDDFKARQKIDAR